MCGSISENIYQSYESWGTEDYVCHVVEWKGIQSSEVTWDYCKNIKQEYVNESEEFWHKQRPTTAEEVKYISERPHPHMRDFKRLSILPSFGVSKVKRPVSDIGKQLSADVAAASSSSNNGENYNEIPALQLRD